MKRSTAICLVLAALLLGLGSPALCVIVQEGGVTLDVGRVLTGATTGSKYYGYSGGTLTLPHDRGGILTFSLWNDMQLGGTAHTNYFIATVGGRALKIPSYATRHQLLEEYVEFRGQWGPAGINRVSIAIPAGVSSLRFDNSGSATGIELSHVTFANGYRPMVDGFEKEQVREPGQSIIQSGRVLTGSKTGEKFYGYQGGTIFLPHGKGGYLTFQVYNDQQFGCTSILNKINLTAGDMQRSFTQYTTAMDLTEDYQEFKNQWGPAGGSRVTIQVPEGVTRIEFDNAGSQSGIEIAQLHFSAGVPIVFQFDEQVNRGSTVCPLFGRTLHGASSDREFFGFDGGRVILPNDKGGVLSFDFWNDQHVNTATTDNQLHITVGAAKQTVQQTTTAGQRTEFYKEFMNQWGPAGGKRVSVQVPAGVALVSFSRSGQTGIELTNFIFQSH